MVTVTTAGGAKSHVRKPENGTTTVKLSSSHGEKWTELRKKIVGLTAVTYQTTTTTTKKGGSGHRGHRGFAARGGCRHREARREVGRHQDGLTLGLQLHGLQQRARLRPVVPLVGAELPGRLMLYPGVLPGREEGQLRPPPRGVHAVAAAGAKGRYQLLRLHQEQEQRGVRGPLARRAAPCPHRRPHTLRRRLSSARGLS